MTGIEVEEYDLQMDRDAILRRIHDLRDEIAMLDRQNRSYSQRGSHSIYEEQMFTSRVERLEQIRRELANMAAGNFHGIDRCA